MNDILENFDFNAVNAAEKRRKLIDDDSNRQELILKRIQQEHRILLKTWVHKLKTDLILTWSLAQQG